MQRDSLANTFRVATILCLVCSLLVSAAAVTLKPMQERNVEVDRQRNILVAAGLDPENLRSADEVSAAFAEVTDIVIDLETGDDVSDEYPELGKYDQIKVAAAKKKGKTTRLGKDDDLARIKTRENHSHVYLYTDANGKKRYIFPVRGLGLWSMLKGFVAIEEDLETIAGLTFYEHAETPGLGGEIDSARFKAAWPGKKLYDAEGNLAISVTKAKIAPEHKVDTLSGATITSDGVQNLLRFWLGPKGFEPYIKKEKLKNATSNKTGDQSKPNAGDNNG